MTESFNPRSRTGNDCGFQLWTGQTKPCFNPRSRTGNDVDAEDIYNEFNPVSIHVPARGTTVFEGGQGLLLDQFQSTFPHGERRQDVSMGVMSHLVSIHVPARGTTTLCICGAFFLYAVSIHVPARGTTSICMSRSGSGKKFQSTFPHGERQQSSTNFLCAFCSYLRNYTNKFRSTQPPTRSSSHFTSKLQCESPWNSMFTPDSHHSVVALPFIKNH